MRVYVSRLGSKKLHKFHLLNYELRSSESRDSSSSVSPSEDCSNSDWTSSSEELNGKNMCYKSVQTDNAMVLHLYNT